MKKKMCDDAATWVAGWRNTICVWHQMWPYYGVIFSVLFCFIFIFFFRIFPLFVVRKLYAYEQSHISVFLFYCSGLREWPKRYRYPRSSRDIFTIIFSPMHSTYAYCYEKRTYFNRIRYCAQCAGQRIWTTRCSIRCRRFWIQYAICCSFCLSSIVIVCQRCCPSITSTAGERERPECANTCTDRHNKTPSSEPTVKKNEFNIHIFIKHFICTNVQNILRVYMQYIYIFFHSHISMEHALKSRFP